MRNEFDANRALAARRIGHAERCLRPRPLVERMARIEARARWATRVSTGLHLLAYAGIVGLLLWMATA